MTFDLFDAQRRGRFYRGNLHAHSTVSDGALPLERVVEIYRQQGYDFVSVTDHFKDVLADTTPYRTGDFTTIIGAELHAPGLANGQKWHMLGIGLPLDFAPLSEGETGQQLAQRAVNSGAFLGLAHPAHYGATAADLLSIECAHGIEVYNQIAGTLNDRAWSWSQADEVLTAGRRVSLFGGDDSHFDISPWQRERGVSALDNDYQDPYPSGFNVWVWVRAEALDPSALVDALKAGDYYTSQGPRFLDITLSSDRSFVDIVTTPVRSLFVSGKPFAAAQQKFGYQFTHTRFPIDDFRGSYVVITAIDEHGMRAWSNPIWLD